MTDRQRRFALAYAESGDAARAAVRAGYDRGDAGRLLKSAGVRAALAELARDPPGAEGDVATAGEVLAYLTGVLRGEADGAATPRMKAAELLGKRLGLFNEAPEPAPPPVIVDDLCEPTEDAGCGPPGEDGEGGGGMAG